MLHLMEGSIRFPVSSLFRLLDQINLERVVEFCFSFSLKVCLCEVIRSLICPEVRPIYDASFISAQYMTDSVLHWPFLRGHSFLQLQGRVVFFLFRFFSILLLWLSMMFFIEGHVLKLILHFFLFITGWRGKV